MDVQTDLGLGCPLKESLATTKNVSMECKGPDETMCMHRMI